MQYFLWNKLDSVKIAVALTKSSHSQMSSNLASRGVAFIDLTAAYDVQCFKNSSYTSFLKLLPDKNLQDHNLSNGLPQEFILAQFRSTHSIPARHYYCKLCITIRLSPSLPRDNLSEKKPRSGGTQADQNLSGSLFCASLSPTWGGKQITWMIGEKIKSYNPGPGWSQEFTYFSC